MEIQTIIGLVLMAPITIYLGYALYPNVRYMMEEDIVLGRVILWGGISFVVGLVLVLI